MSSSNINDPNAIKALLDQLRSSEAWQNAVNANAAVAAQASQPALAANTAPAAQDAIPATGSTASALSPRNALQTPHDGPHGAVAPPSQASGSSNSNAHSTVASLLSQLHTSSSLAAVVAGSSTGSAPIARPRPPPPAGSSDFPGPDAAALLSSTGTGAGTSPHMDTDEGPVPTPSPRQDLRACTFQQALPHLARLSADEGFLKALAAMKAEQADLERQLWRERRDIQRKHEEKVNTARTKASIIGAGLTPYEADALTDSFRAELLRFDRDRVLPAWDGLLSKQQAALESLGVPAMFPTSQAEDRERQQEVMQVLGRLVNTKSPLSPGADG